MNDRDQPETVRLLLEYLDNSLTPEQEDRLNEWKSAHETNKAAFESLGDATAILGLLLDPDIHQEETKTRIPFLGAVIRAAACIIGALGLLYLLLPENAPTTQTGQQIAPQSAGAKVVRTWTVPYGKTDSINLPDGSRVWLNNGSTLSYPADFSNSNRWVRLLGEAYFEVAPNARIPFIAMVEQMRIEVLGTSFTVKAYPEEHSVKTTLLKGNVSVIAGGVPRLLQPGQQAIIKDRVVEVTPGDTVGAIAWKNGEFDFNGADVSTIFHALERWYNVHIICKDAFALGTYHGRIEKSLPLNDVLQGLTAEKLHFKRNGDSVFVVN